MSIFIFILPPLLLLHYVICLSSLVHFLHHMRDSEHEMQETIHDL
ncbi:hypothetical protein JMA_02490 [Jeotgalibacillus malaysiensis]|uniref:Uncharacterized protein n=1 Tax=Jeotgalibacillus malaysiensis TaxID=1508404 RepID=A0A0B5AGS1_9BACL|nr:hypothetical protein JMA_02490 [Jeotgalibacillus malaysiensis]